MKRGGRINGWLCGGLALAMSVLGAVAAGAEERTALVVDLRRSFDAEQSAAIVAADAEIVAIIGAPRTQQEFLTHPVVAALRKAGYQSELGHPTGSTRPGVMFRTRSFIFQRSFTLISQTRAICGDIENVDARSPVVAEFRDPNGAPRLWFMINDIDTEDPSLRQCQAAAINSWSRRNTVATLALGRFGRPLPQPLSPSDPALSDVTADGVYTLVETSVTDAPACSAPLDPIVTAERAFVGGRGHDFKASARLVPIRTDVCPTTADDYLLAVTFRD